MAGPSRTETSSVPAAPGDDRTSFAYRATRVTFGFLCWLLTRRKWSGVNNIPVTGPVLIAVNHVGHADPGCTALFIDNAGRHPRFMAKAELLKVPVLAYLMRRTGQIPVYRQTRDARAALVDAISCLESGGCVVVYPEGTITKDPDMWPMSARTGIARLFLATGAPVVPVAQWGVHTIRWQWRPWRRVVAQMVAGPAVDLDRFRGMKSTPALLDEITNVVMAALRDEVSALRGQPAPSVTWDNRLKTHVPIADSSGSSKPGEGKRTA